MLVRKLTRRELEEAMNAIATLRIEVFREFPYLYEGSLSYEHKYLSRYLDSPDAIVVGVFPPHSDSPKDLVGAVTGIPLADELSEIQEPFVHAGRAIHGVYYIGEFVLARQYRGHGLGNQLFAEMLAAISEKQRFREIALCVVKRPEFHALRPAGYTPLDRFWEKHGFRLADQLVCRLDWPDLGTSQSTSKELVFWLK